ncbi:hypothetical protein L1049_026881 [Liquidambar formosana]|uniref:Uncharacterized protein n=1 Tax=Liquidambar formosana TaxID=63359 RepID=A0AAP0R938_LIQFO
MGNLVEEKALGDGQWLDGLHVFFGEDSDESDGSFARDWAEEDHEELDASESQDPTERTKYWESQEALLQEILERYSLTGSKLRQEVSRVIEMARERDLCHCPKPSSNTCAYCLRRRVVKFLCDQGFHATLCTSKWNNTHKFPGGTHEYIEVIASTQGRKKQIPFVVEIEFRDEFEMAKACEEYQRLINQLPETYIGKADYLNAMVRIVCSAAKRSAKDKKIHMGPWRKTSFMQMKWSGSYVKPSSLDDQPSTRQVQHVPMVTSFFHLSAGTAVAVT